MVKHRILFTCDKIFEDHDTDYNKPLISRPLASFPIFQGSLDILQHIFFMSCEFCVAVSSRHSRFGGSFVVQGLKAIGEKDVIYHRNLNNVSHQPFKPSPLQRDEKSAAHAFGFDCAVQMLHSRPGKGGEASP